MGASYIVTDLCIRADFDFIQLDSELIKVGMFGVKRAFEGIWSASYSSREGVYSPVSAIIQLVEIVEKLSSEAHSEWDRCISRRFDMGFESYKERFHSGWDIPSHVLQRIIDVNGSLAVAIYRDDNSKDTEK